jgi:hypothetical protein
MMLQRGEQILRQGLGVWDASGIRTTGTLSLTNLRVVFEAIGKRPYTAVDINLERVWNVHVGETRRLLSGRQGLMILETQAGEVTFELAEPKPWTQALVDAKSSVPPPPPPPSSGATTPPVIVNVKAAPAPKVLARCRYCGALFDSASGRCDQCGAKL